MANAWIIEPVAATVTASETAAGSSSAYVTNDYAGVVWQSAGGAAPTLNIDLGHDAPVDTVLLFGLSGFDASHTATLRIATAAQGNAFGVGAFTYIANGELVLAGSSMPVNGLGVGVYSVAAPITGRYLRFDFAGLPGAVQISRIVIGRRVQLQRNFSYGGGPGVKDLGSMDFSRRGVIMRAIGKKLRILSLTFSNIQKDELQASIRPLLERQGITGPIAIVTDPAIDADRQNRCYFGMLVGDLGAIQRNAVAYEAKTNLVSLF